MTVKEHYDNHLGSFYSWYIGDFQRNKEEFKAFCSENGIIPAVSKKAIDLGCGNGIQAVALAENGYMVKAVDFSRGLLSELESRTGELPIEIICDDIRLIKKHAAFRPDLITCCGDTLSQLESAGEIRVLFKNSSEILSPKGKILLTFRDSSNELADTNRFIHVKSDSRRIMTCFLEYFPEKIRVTDLLYENEKGEWVQKISSYYKTRLSKQMVTGFLRESGFNIVCDKKFAGMEAFIGEKEI